jgi:hypothetical protein
MATQVFGKRLDRTEGCVSQKLFSVIGVAGKNTLAQYHYAVDVLKEITRKNDVS